MIAEPIYQKRKFYMSCGKFNHVMLAEDCTSACTFFIKMVLGMNKHPKIGQYIYISEGGFKKDIEAYCAPLTLPPIIITKTEHILRDINRIDLADKLMLFYEKGSKNDYVV